MKPLPFIIFGVYILLYVLAGFIFGVMPVVNALVVMFILATECPSCKKHIAAWAANSDTFMYLGASNARSSGELPAV